MRDNSMSRTAETRPSAWARKGLCRHILLGVLDDPFHDVAGDLELLPLPDIVLVTHSETAAF